MTDLLSAPAPLAATHRQRGGLRLWIVLGVIGVAIATLLAFGLGSSLDYFDTVNQALAHRSTLGTTSFRLEGVVVPGSIRRQGLQTDFRVCEGANEIAVVNSGSPPQLFQSSIPVVVIGHFAASPVPEFISNGIEVKHSANYVAAHPGRVALPAHPC